MKKGDSLLSGKTLAPIFILILLLFLPLFSGPYILYILILVFMYAIVAMSLDVMIGYTGILSLGSAGFLGIGAYVSALASTNLMISPWLSIFIGGFVAAMIGSGVGLVCRTMGKVYLAMATIAFSELLRLVVVTEVGITRGESGLTGIPPFSPITIPNLVTIKFGTASNIPDYFLALTLFMFSLVALRMMMRSKIGYFFKSIRDNEDAAESLGINVVKYKVLCFGVSSFFAGMAGGFYASYIGTITPELLSLSTTLTVVVILYVGGVRTLYGAAVGSVLIIFLLQVFYGLGSTSAIIGLLIYSVLLIMIVRFLPKGIFRMLSDGLKRLASTS